MDIFEHILISVIIKYTLPADYQTYKLGEEVLAYSETKNYWIGSLIFIAYTGRMIKILSMDVKQCHTFKSFQIKLYIKIFDSSIVSYSSEPYIMTQYIVHITNIKSHDLRALTFHGPKKKEMEGLYKSIIWKK